MELTRTASAVLRFQRRHRARTMRRLELPIERQRRFAWYVVVVAAVVVALALKAVLS